MRDDYIFRESLQALDPDLHNLIEREAERQRRTIILIASESEAPPAVHEAVASPFAHIYAEGYPRESSRKQSEEQILDIAAEVAHYRRLSDPRYYKGVEYADVLEALTRRRAAELFAANGLSADDIYVNVQPLSGGPANSAVYTALLNPGETVMGLKLTDGGHLSHGAPVNRSGLVYKSVSYTVDPESEVLDYDAIEKLAVQVKPRIIVAGYSAYPLIIDWQRFRQIADKVGAYLLADIAHISGLVAAGVHPSPIGIADVVSTTTHKSLCGPRGAMIMTHRADISSKIDKAVFPGEQGGPHLNAIAGLAVALKLAQSDKFKALQRQIAANAARLAEQLQARGLRVVGGKSENHLLLVDCKSIRIDDVPLSGDMAARILDVANIVLNRNNIPGDKSAINPFGVRIGLVWPTQRGFRAAEVDKLADAIATLFHGARPFYYRGSSGKLFRAKVDPAALAHARQIVADLTGTDVVVVDPARRTVQVRGSEAGRFLDGALTSDVAALTVGAQQPTRVLGHALEADAIVLRRANDSYDLHFADAETADAARLWLADLSDGYVDFGNLHGKLPGPVAITAIVTPEGAPLPDGQANPYCDDKPYFVGQQQRPAGEALPAFSWQPPANQALKRTELYDTHKALGAKLVPFGGYDMPVWYTSVSDEHEAVRKAAGLFDVSHMGVFEAAGPYAAAFLDLVTTANTDRLAVGASQYTYLLDPDGRVIDDLIVYRTGGDKYMLVVNAANNDEDWVWLNAVNNGTVRIDNERPWARFQHPVALRDLRDPASGADRRVDLALQGPNAQKILLALGSDGDLERLVQNLPWGGLVHGTFGGFDLIVSRTGYTGERTAFELFVHPDCAVELWQALLGVGAEYGLKPAGLAARDSTRTEAGLPLHGHELAGPLALNPLEAGFGKFVKLHKPFFIGRAAYIAQMLTQERAIVRFRMDEKGVRRPEIGDPIVDKRGRVIGTVTSCAIDSDGYLLGLAAVPQDLRKSGTQLAIYQTGGGSRPIKADASVALGARLPVPNTATVLTRFPKR